MLVHRLMRIELNSWPRMSASDNSASAARPDPEPQRCDDGAVAAAGAGVPLVMVYEATATGLSFIPDFCTSALMVDATLTAMALA